MPPTFLTQSIILPLLLIFFLSSVRGTENAWGPGQGLPSGKPNCTLRPGQKMLSVLPGSGWDNLVNEERGLTTNREVYSLCRFSPDGNYLVPNDMVIEPVKSSQIELSSTVFSHFTNYTTLTAFSMNSASDIKFNLVSVGGDYSFEKDIVRKAVNERNRVTVRSQLRHSWYVVHQLPDPHLHPRFRNRLLDVAAHLERSNITLEDGDATDLRALVGRRGIGPLAESRDPNEAEKNRRAVFRVVDNLRAAYLADLIVRDFGTHTVVDVEVGAVVAKIDSVVGSSSTMTKEDKWQLEAVASASFANFFRFKTSATMTEIDKSVEAYNSKVISSIVLSHGGPSLKVSDRNLTEWEESLADHLVAIDRRGRPIYDLITPRALPELSETLTFRLAATVKAAVERYYDANSVVGCLDPRSAAYDSDANVAADHCDDVPYRDPTADDEGAQLPFGGVYTVCEGPDDLCSRYIAPNLATGGTSCPTDYKAVSLLPPQVRTCAVKCQDQGLFHSPLCVHECAITHAFWCALDPATAPAVSTDVKKELGFLFGGLYTDTMANSITNAQSCPLYYEAQPVGRRIKVCLSTDRELGRRYSLAFGGFYACQSGNPLYGVLSLNATSIIKIQEMKRKLHAGLNIGANNDTESTDGENSVLIWPKQCPNGYTSHMAGVEDTCLVNYCIPGNSSKIVRERRLKRPPFVQLPEFADTAASPDLEKALNQPLRLTNSLSGRTYRSEEGEWVADADANGNGTADSKMYTALVAAVVVAVVLLVVVIGFVTHCVFRKAARLRLQAPSGRVGVPRF